MTTLLSEYSPREITVESSEGLALKSKIEGQHDPESERLQRFMGMKDLSRTDGSPIKELVERAQRIESLSHFDRIKAPEIVRADISFDLFNFPQDHPARSRSDTYYVNDEYILRPHTTIMWYYHLLDEITKQRMAEGKPIGAISHGKVYRKDEIDRHHMNIFHQMDGWYLSPKSEGEIGTADLTNVLGEIAKSIFGPNIKYRFNKDNFPYTDPSIEMEIEKDGKWIEVLGGGVVRGEVLRNLGADPDQYSGWAFGFGLERLAIVSMELPDIRLLWSEDERVKRQLNLGNKFSEVSKYPPIVRDISFVVDKNFVANDYFDLIRELGGNLIEEVVLVDQYEDENKFGKGKKSYTFRVVYRHLDRTLTNTEVNDLHKKLEDRTASDFGALIRS